MYTRNKPYFCGLYCCSCFVLTICATRDVILPVKYVLYVVIIIIIIIIVMLLFCCCCSSSILFWRKTEAQDILNVLHSTGWGISRLTPQWGVRLLTPLHPTNGMSYAPGPQYIVVGGKSVRNAWHGCHGRHLQGRQQTVRGIKGCWPTYASLCITYSGAGKSLARPGRKQVTAIEDFDFHIPYL